MFGRSLNAEIKARIECTLRCSVFPVKSLQSCSVSWVSIRSWRNRQDRRQASGSWEAFLSVKWNPAAQTVRAIACQVYCNAQLSIIWLAHFVVTDTVSELQWDFHCCRRLVNGEGNGFGWILDGVFMMRSIRDRKPKCEWMCLHIQKSADCFRWDIDNK